MTILLYTYFFIRKNQLSSTLSAVAFVPEDTVFISCKSCLQTFEWIRPLQSAVHIKAREWKTSQRRPPLIHELRFFFLNSPDGVVLLQDGVSKEIRPIKPMLFRFYLHWVGILFFHKPWWAWGVENQIQDNPSRSSTRAAGSTRWATASRLTSIPLIFFSWHLNSIWQLLCESKLINSQNQSDHMLS